MLPLAQVVVSVGPSVVVVLEEAVVVLLSGSDKHQGEALKVAARYADTLDDVHGLPTGRDVAIFSRQSNLTP